MNELTDRIITLPEALSILKQLGNQLPIGIMLSNLDGMSFYQNHAFQTWLPDYEVETRLWLLQMQPYLDNGQTADENLPHHTLALFEQNNYTHETEISVFWQNHRYFFRISTNPLYDQNNNIVGLIEITEHITALKQMESTLQQSRRFETVGRLASGIAHDFNNILQVINGHSEILLETYTDDARLMRSVDVIFSSGQKASALTRQLLLFSRRQQNEFKHINLGNLILGMHKIISRMIGEDIEMKLSCNDANIYIEGDESQIEQILMNLAVNSRDAMPNGGEISITVDTCEIGENTPLENNFSKPGKYVVLHFVDTGVGMNNEIIEHIFEPFFTTKETGHGTGLGLATVYSIVKQHQGYIQVESAPGKGSAFTIYFPYCDSRMFYDPVEVDEHIRAGGEERVLIIEDDENVRDLASQVLSHYGYKVDCVSNLAQAHRLAASTSFDLFLIDIVLPDGSGMEFIEMTQGNNPEAAYILSSGYTEDKPQIRETIQKGYTFLHKPYTINALLSACHEALRKKKQP